VASLAAHGIGLHAVTAEPGGDAHIRERLIARDTNLSFIVHSDPEGALLPSGDVLYCNEIDKSRDYVGAQSFEIQPALVVLDPTGQIVRHWSWSDVSGVENARMDEEVEYADPGQVLISKQDAGVRSADAEDKDTWLVNVRVPAADLLPALLEGRPFKQEEVESRTETTKFHYETLGVEPIMPTKVQ